MTEDTEDKHMHLSPLAYVAQASQNWTCGGELVNACKGFSSIWIAAATLSRVVMTCTREKFPIVGEHNVEEAEDYALSSGAIGALLIHFAIQKGDIDLLDPLVTLDPRGLHPVDMSLVDYIVHQAFELRSIETDDLTVSPQDDPISAAVSDVRLLCDAAKLQTVLARKSSTLFGSGRPKPARTKTDLN